MSGICLFVVSVILVIGRNTVSGAVYQTETQPHQLPYLALDNNHPVVFCMYEGIKVLPATHILNWDTCQNCTCSEDGLECLMLVSHTYNYADDSPCEVVFAGCLDIWVMKNDPWMKCPPEMIPEHTIVGP